MSHIGLQLFIQHGFDKTTVDDIANAAGIGRRTFFRYFTSKNDLPWGDFDDMIASMRDYLFALPAEVPIRDALRTAVLEFNRFPEHEFTYHRQRMDLLLNVPSLVAHSTLRYADWRQVIADFIAARLDLDPQDLIPQTTAWAMLAASLAAYEQWLRHEDADLLELLGTTLRLISTGFDLTEASAAATMDAGSAEAAALEAAAAKTAASKTAASKSAASKTAASKSAATKSAKAANKSK